MERLNPGHLLRPSLYAEHSARYEWASRFLSTGQTVVDCACGAGYGAHLISKSSPQSDIIGFDVSIDALAHARENFEADNLSFRHSAIEDIGSHLSGIDSFISFETLEHTQVPGLALAAIRSALADSGLLVGSVPSEHYEASCERIFGPNIYHLHRFSKAQLENLLRNEFEHVWIGVAVFGLGTVIEGLNFNTISTIFNREEISASEPMGSFVFLASNSSERFRGACEKLHSVYSFGVDFATFYESEINPVYETVKNVEDMVGKRDSYISQLENNVSELKYTIKDVERLVDERDAYIKQLEDRVNQLKEHHEVPRADMLGGRRPKEVKKVSKKSSLAQKIKTSVGKNPLINGWINRKQRLKGQKND